MLEVLFSNSMEGILRAYNISEGIYKIPYYICGKRRYFSMNEISNWCKNHVDAIWNTFQKYLTTFCHRHTNPTEPKQFWMGWVFVDH